MTFDEWRKDRYFLVREEDRIFGKACFDAGYQMGQRELLLELTKAKMDGADTVTAAEMQRVKNFRSLL